MALKERTANYRRCFLTDGEGKDASDGQTLQSALEYAMTHVPQPWRRSLGISGSFCHLLTERASRHSCLCGEIVFYDTERMIPLVDIDKSGATWRGIISPKDAEGIPRKFQEQALFFAIRENHVAVIQATHLDVEVLRDFLAWLIQDKAKLLPNALIDLRNMPAKEALAKLKDHRISAIRFGEPLFEKVSTEVAPEEGKQPSKRKRYTHTIKTSNLATDILAGLGVSKPIIDKIAGGGSPGSVQIDVEISYRSRSEKDSVAVLQSLAQTLGTRPELSPEIVLSDKSKITKDQLTKRGTVSVQFDGGRIGVDDAFSKLAYWLATQLQSGQIS